VNPLRSSSRSFVHAFTQVLASALAIGANTARSQPIFATVLAAVGTPPAACPPPSVAPPIRSRSKVRRFVQPAPSPRRRRSILNADPFFAWLSFLGSNPCTRALLGGGKLQLCGLSARAAVQIFLVGTHGKGGIQRRRFVGNLFAPPLG